MKPSSDLTALSIGSYVCQARAASQTDQAVWDFVAAAGAQRRAPIPLTAPAQWRRPRARFNSATADYIRIATDELC